MSQTQGKRVDTAEHVEALRVPNLVTPTVDGYLQSDKNGNALRLATRGTWS